MMPVDGSSEEILRRCSAIKRVQGNHGSDVKARRKSIGLAVSPRHCARTKSSDQYEKLVHIRAGFAREKSAKKSHNSEGVFIKRGY
jgi:hypothetical protein